MKGMCKEETNESPLPFHIMMAGLLLAGCSTEREKGGGREHQAARADRNAYRYRRDTKGGQNHFRDRIRCIPMRRYRSAPKCPAAFQHTRRFRPERSQRTGDRRAGQTGAEPRASSAAKPRWRRRWPVWDSTQQENVRPETTPSIRQAQAQMEDAKSKYDNASRLVKTGDISQERFTEIQKQYQSRQALLSRARRGANIDGARCRR